MRLMHRLEAAILDFGSHIIRTSLHIVFSLCLLLEISVELPSVPYGVKQSKSGSVLPWR